MDAGVTTMHAGVSRGDRYHTLWLPSFVASSFQDHTCILTRCSVMQMPGKPSLYRGAPGGGGGREGGMLQRRREATAAQPHCAGESNKMANMESAATCPKCKNSKSPLQFSQSEYAR